MPKNPFPWRLALNLTKAMITGAQRSFREDSQDCAALLKPPLEVLGEEHIPRRGPCLLTPNHYTHAGFRAWWIALGVSAVVPMSIHWVMTAAWRFDGKPCARPLAPLTRGFFQRIARVYGFTTMPPMPPDPKETEDRARAVLRVVEYARSAPQPVIGLVPEGRDMAVGCLGTPPSGAGRFIFLLAAYCRQIVPVGIYEEGNRLRLCFGEAYSLNMPPDVDRNQRDRQVSQVVMRAIARLLPPELQGEFR